MVSFSQNGYSEELLKVEQHFNAKETRKGYEESGQKEDNQPPPGFDFERDTINADNDYSLSL